MTLQEVVDRLRACRRRGEVVATLLDMLPAFVGADGVGFYAFAADGSVDLDWAGIDDVAVDRYDACMRSGAFADPLLHAALDRTQALSEQSFFDDPMWLSLYNESARPFGYRHVAIAPVVVFDGTLAAVSCLRADGGRGFSSHELQRLMSISVWASSALSRLGAADGERPLLTVRQREIAELVLRGLTNGEIAAVLRITENTVKKHLKDIFLQQGISRRAELATILR
jgi:DNA-binding CsgD family transcriptional regulator